MEKRNKVRDGGRGRSWGRGLKAVDRFKGVFQK